MKSKSRQLGPSDKPVQPQRTSRRIAERQPLQPATTTGTRHTDLGIHATKRKASTSKVVGPSQKQAPPSKPERAVRKKQAAPNRSGPSRKEEVSKPSISRYALKQNERRTAYEPLPDDLAKFKPDIPPPDSDEMPSTYDPEMPSTLDKCGIFDQQWDELTSDLKQPHNFQALKMETMVPHPIDGEREQDILGYKEWFETTSVPSYNEATVTPWCRNYLDIKDMRLDKPNYKAEKMKFKAPADSQIRKFTPEPDYTEGIASTEMPPWIKDNLALYAHPSTEIAIPNFMAEFKAKGNMQIAHQQARLNGGAAAQGYFKLLTLCNVGEPPFDKALVGTIESNAEIIIGNVHWATKSRDKSRAVDYHMRRVFHHFTLGIDRQDYFRCRDQARRFRNHFRKVREDILAKLCKLTVPPPRPRSYDNTKIEDLKLLCRERNLRTTGKKAELVKRLQDHDVGQSNPSNPVTPSPSISITSVSDDATQLEATQEDIHHSFAEPSTRRLRDQSVEDEGPSQNSRHSKKRRSQ